MFTLLTKLRVLQLVRQELIPFSLAMVTAEVFYHFGSFSLECGAFLLTWWGIGKLGSYMSRGE